MENNLIHVNSYVKDDGTHVKDYFRRKPDSNYGDNHKMNVLEGRVEMNDFPANIPMKKSEPPQQSTDSGSDGSVLRGILSAAAIALNIGSAAMKAVSKLQTAQHQSGNYEVPELKTALNSHLQQMKAAQKKAEINYQNNLDKLVNTKNQNEYANLYKTIIQEREINTKISDSVKRIEHAAEHEDYKTLSDELQNYQSNYNDVVKKIQKEQPLMQEVQPNKAYTNISTPVPTPYLNANVQPNFISEAKLPDMPQFDLEQIKRTGLHDYPYAESSFIYFGLLRKNLQKNIYDAIEFWKLAKSHLNENSQYIKDNGYILNSINQLPEYLKKYMHDKLHEQLGVTDSRGILLKSGSSLSRQISQSREFAELIKRNSMVLLNGKIVNKDSINFLSNENLHLSLGHADVLNAFIDSNGNLNAIIADTYDFNKDDPDWKVEWAYNVQENNLIENYFVLCIISIPFLQWIRMLY